MTPLLLLPLLLSVAWAHQSLSEISMSRQVACRISNRQNCPGPCPNTDFRIDANKNNPSMTVRRGQVVHVRTLRNNHEGGFGRWTLVNVKDMYNKRAHADNAFLWDCADTNIAYCKPRFKNRDCYYDLKNAFYNHYVRIPKIYSDGVYVLGWVWLGGGGTWGHFGDYYDCSYIEVKGGPFAGSHQPEFRAGNSPLSKRGMCTATVNKVGVCWREPCPGGGKFTKLMKPFEFTNRLPRPIPARRFKWPHKIPKSSVSIRSLSIYKLTWDARLGKRLHRTGASRASRKPYLHLLRKMGLTIVADTTGPVRSVHWYIDGRKVKHADTTKPYTIAGDWQVGWKTFTPRFAKWQFVVDYKVSTVSCKAIGKDGTEAWHTMEISTW